MVGERLLEDADDERLSALIDSVRAEAVLSFVVLLVGSASVIAASLMNLTGGWLSFAILMLLMGILRYLPQRRLFPLRTLLQLRRDLTAHRVYTCRTGEVTLEVLAHSHLVWSRNGETVSPPVIAHATATAATPDHAAMAANFVRPTEHDAQFHIHQRTLTADELLELESYGPRPSFVLTALAAVGVIGTVATYTWAALGRLPTLAPAVLFFAIGTWATWKVVKARRAHRHIRADLEAGYVVIIRVRQGGDLGPPTEVLPVSTIVWTESGTVAGWRKRWSAFKER